MTMRDSCNMPTIAKLAPAAHCCLFILWLLSLLRQSGNKQFILERAAGSHPARFYLTVKWSPPREKEGSWYVMLTQERREATVWTIDSVAHGEPCQVTISTTLGGTRTVYLTAIGNSESGAVACLEEQGRAVIVDTVNAEEARWFQHG